MKPNLTTLIIAVAIAIPLAAYAAVPEAATVSIPYGDWLTAILQSAAATFAAVVSWIVANYAPAVIKSYLTTEAVRAAVDYAIATIANAEHGKTLDLSVANKVIAQAANYAITSEPKLAAWIGDELRPLIAAKLASLNMLPAESTNKNLNIR